MATALNVHATKDYILKSDLNEDGTPKADATVWQLGAMTSYMEAHVTSLGVRYDTSSLTSVEGLSESEINKQVKIDVDFHSMAIEGVSLCLKGWKNFKDSDGNDLEFKTLSRNIKGKTYKVVHPELMEVISKDIIVELYSQIQDLSSLKAADVKNSDTGS